MEFSRAEFEALESVGVTRAWNGLGGSHTFVTYPPLDALRSLSPEPVLSRLIDVRDFSLYVHIPYCEMTCPFCPYERTAISESAAADTYLRALFMEMKAISGKLQKGVVQSLYVGGGTATILHEAQLKSLMGSLKDHFQFSTDCVICIETSPNALVENSAKAGLLKELGVNRVSVGVQTLSETALRSEGRTHTPDETMRMLSELIREIHTVNVDLMQDMPGQTDDDMENDLALIASLRPTQITSYVERLRKWHGEYPDSYRSVVRRLSLRDTLLELSYQPRPGGRFTRNGGAEDPFKNVRCGVTSNLIGLGASSYGHVSGVFYRNIVDTGAYINLIHAGQSPIATGLPMSDVDVMAGSLASGIRWGVRLPQSYLGRDEYLDDAKRKLDVLIEHKLVRFDGDRELYEITLDGFGWAYEEEICSLFVPQNIVDGIRAKNLPWWSSVLNH